MIVAIVLNYCTPCDTAKATRSLIECQAVHHIVIVDNASHDGSAELLGSEFTGHDKVTIRVTSKNLGYAAGNNVGLAVALDMGASYVLIHNPDVLLHNGTVETLRAGISDRIPVTTPVLYRTTDLRTLDCWGGWRYNRWTTRSTPLQSPDRTTEAYFTGACFLAQTRFLEEVGGLPETYFLFFEEPDLTRRLRMSGRDWATPEGASGVHGRGSAILGTESKSLIGVLHAARSAVLYTRRWEPAALPTVVSLRILWALALLRYSSRHSWAAFRGIWLGVRTRTCKP